MQGIDKETVIFSPFPQYLDGNEYISYDIFGKPEPDQNGNRGRYVKIGTVAPDTRGLVSWINDRHVTIFSGCYLTDGSSLQNFAESRVGNLSFELGSGNPPPQTTENN